MQNNLLFFTFVLLEFCKRMALYSGSKTEQAKNEYLWELELMVIELKLPDDFLSLLLCWLRGFKVPFWTHFRLFVRMLFLTYISIRVFYYV